MNLSTIQQSFSIILNICTLVAVFYGFYRFTRKPSETVNQRLESIEEWQEHAERRLASGVRHFVSLDDQNQVIEQSMLTILDALGDIPGLPPERVAEVQKRRDELFCYLTTRRAVDMGTKDI